MHAWIQAQVSSCLGFFANVRFGTKVNVKICFSEEFLPVWLSDGLLDRDNSPMQRTSFILVTWSAPSALPQGYSLSKHSPCGRCVLWLGHIQEVIHEIKCFLATWGRQTKVVERSNDKSLPSSCLFPHLAATAQHYHSIAVVLSRIFPSFFAPFLVSTTSRRKYLVV